MICDNISVNENGHLSFAGYDTVNLAKKYGTPLYLFDEEKIREHIRTYKNSMAKYLPEGSSPEYASKAFACKKMYEIMAEEGIDIDVVSPGELYTAFKAGFPMENCFFHGNNKTDADILFAIEKGTGYFVVDNFEELYAIDRIAEEKGIVQKILLRLTPGIDPHTHKKIATGSVESKFGVAIETSQAKDFTKTALALQRISLCGFHCHIGSQIFESSPFSTAADIMLGFIKEIRDETGFFPKYLNIGGGFGVRYVESDPMINYEEKIKETADKIKNICSEYKLPVPAILMEPGRSIIADAGMTLYTVGSVKEITGYKNYVSVDGGMTDNPRFALYESAYTVEVASKASDTKNFTASVVGRCCESGDIIQENVLMPKPQRGDIMAVLTTGAYNYSMASNYNRIARPAAVMLGADKDYVIIERESLEDLVSLDK